MRATQKQRLNSVFFKQALTMKNASELTGIDRANICRHVAKLRATNSIYLVRKGICPITKDIAGFYTTNYDLYLSLKGLK